MRYSKAFSGSVLMANLIASALLTAGCNREGRDVDFRERYQEEPSQPGSVSGTTAAPAEPGAKSDVKNPAAANDPTQSPPKATATPQTKKTK